MILGFDSSTSTVGYSFFNNDKIMDAGFIDISKYETSKDKTQHVIKTLSTNQYLCEVTEVNLEAALFGFMGGKTSQQTIIKLARFNAVFEYIISEEWKVPIRLMNVSTARKKVLGRCRLKGMTGKEYVRQELPRRYPEVVQFEKKNRKNEWDAKNADMYDAVIISAA
jgi:hypothetical protein